jgi:hypothetical protein
MDELGRGRRKIDEEDINPHSNWGYVGSRASLQSFLTPTEIQEGMAFASGPGNPLLFRSAD